MKKSYLLHLLIFIISTFITFETSASGSNNSVNRATLQQIESSHSFKIDPPPKAIRVSRKNPQITGMKRIQQGMPYEKARKILIEQGWQPNIPASNGGFPNFENSQIKTHIPHFEKVLSKSSSFRSRDDTNCCLSSFPPHPSPLTPHP